MSSDEGATEAQRGRLRWADSELDYIGPPIADFRAKPRRAIAGGRAVGTVRHKHDPRPMACRSRDRLEI
jgi:hypothetical protein